MATARAEADPTIALKGALIAPSVRSHAAITTPKALGGLLRAIDAYDGQPSTRLALKLLALLFPRPGELRLAERSEFDFRKRVWTIPRSEEHTSELQSLMRISYAVLCLKKKKTI